jgi:hypothetical protein
MTTNREETGFGFELTGISAVLALFVVFGLIGLSIESCNGARRYEACVKHHTPKECE